MKKILFLIYLLFGLCESSAQAFYIPMSAVPQILRTNDAQGIAMGLTGVSYREGLFSTYTNPAGLRFDDIEFSFSHIPATIKYRDMKFNQEAFGFGLPLKNNYMLGINLYNLNYGKFETYDYELNKHKEERAGLLELQASASKIFISKQNLLSFGISVKHMHLYFSSMDAKTFLIDIGMRWRFNLKNSWNSFGISVSNLGKELKHDGYTVDEPVKLLRIGFTNATHSTDVNYMYTMEYQRSLNKKKTHILWNHLGIGIELQFLKTMFCRLGYNFDFDDVKKENKVQGLTYGIGFKTPQKIKFFVPLNISLNYGKGITDYRELNENVISIILGFDL